MNKWTIIVLLGFLVWGGISWRWYTCEIKGFCGAIITKEEFIPVQNRVVVESSIARRERQRDTETTIECDPYITTTMSRGSESSDVIRLEQFLNTYEDEDLVVDGSFGQAEESAVARFQEKYRDAIFASQQTSVATGRVDASTRTYVNALNCARAYLETN